MYFKLMSNQNELNTEKDVFYSFEEYTNIKKRVRLLRQERNNFFQKRAGDTSFKNSDENILFSNLSLKSKSLISNVKNNYSISNRGLYKILNLALTIAIFNNREEISESDILESLSFRYTNSS
jgi:predicted ATPase with chaperone activity